MISDKRWQLTKGTSHPQWQKIIVGENYSKKCDKCQNVTSYEKLKWKKLQVKRNYKYGKLTSVQKRQVKKRKKSDQWYAKTGEKQPWVIFYKKGKGTKSGNLL